MADEREAWRSVTTEYECPCGSCRERRRAEEAEALVVRYREALEESERLFEQIKVNWHTARTIAREGRDKARAVLGDGR